MNALLISPFFGIFGLCFLFILSFFVVHIIKLARIGYRAQTPAPKAETKREEEKKEAPSKQTSKEPVYYIVEKKRRAKTSYSPPKEIRFQ